MATNKPAPARKNTAGGSAMAGGDRFQAQCVTWFATHILLRTPLGQNFGLYDPSVAERITCETAESLDDIQVDLSNGESLCCQSKRSLSFSAKANSSFGSTIAQCFAQLQRPHVDTGEQRYVLIYGESNKNLKTLSALLDRHRTSAAGTALASVAHNKEEAEIAKKMDSLFSELESSGTCTGITAKVDEILRRLHLLELHFEPNEADHTACLNSLQHHLLREPEKALQAIDALMRMGNELAAQRKSVGRNEIRKHLSQVGIALQETIDYRDDLRRLSDLSTTEIHSQAAQLKKAIAIDGKQLTVERPVVDAMLEMAQRGSFLVTGVAGDGKTGCQLSLAEKLEKLGKKVIYWPADSLQQSSIHEMATVLQLQHRWQELFEELGDEGYLIIDGLDGLRDTASQGAYRQLMRVAMVAGVHVIASIRAFDLQYSRDLHDLFRGTNVAPAKYVNAAFNSISHIQVLELEKEEFQQVIDQLPGVAAVLKKVPALEPIVKNLFSLDLLCRLLSGGATASELSPISTQGELFELFWNRRVRADTEKAPKMEGDLESLIEQMVSERKLQVPIGKTAQDTRQALFSMDVLRHPSMPAGYLPADDLVEFRHHLLFDYAAELLFIRKRRRQLVTELSGADTWGLFLRPSLILFHRNLWAKARKEFWGIVEMLEDSSVPPLQRIPGYLVIAEEAKEVSDLEPLLAKGKDSNPSPIQGVVSAFEFLASRGHFSEKTQECWLTWAGKLIATGHSHLAHLGRRILDVAANHHEQLTPEGKRLMNVAAIALVEFYWKQGVNSSFLSRPLQWICKTISVNKEPSIPVLRRGFDPKEMAKIGYQGGEFIAFNVQHLWNVAPELVVEMFQTIFAHSEMDDSPSEPMGGQILSLVSNKRQDFGGIGHSLAEKFPDFLKDQPVHATEALIAAVRSKLQKEDRWLEEPDIHDLQWDNEKAQFIEDGCYIWDDGQYPDEEERMLEDWENFLIKMNERRDAAVIWDSIRGILIREPMFAALYRRLLHAASQAPEFFSERVGGLLLNPPILLKSETETEARECITAFDAKDGSKTKEIEKIALAIDKSNFPPTDNEEFLARFIPEKKARILFAVPAPNRSADSLAFLQQSGLQEDELAEKLSRSRIYSSSSIATEEEFMAEEGIDVAADLTKEFLKEGEFLKDLDEKDFDEQNARDLFEQTESYLEKIRDRAKEMDPKLFDRLRRKTTTAFKIIARSKKLTEPTLSNRLREHLETALKESNLQEDKEHFGINERAYAADGLLAILHMKNELEDADKVLLRDLANNPDPGARYELAAWLWTFLEKWPEFIWETLERWLQELPLKGGTSKVLKCAFQSGWLWWLRKRDEARADLLLQEVRAQAKKINDGELLRMVGAYMSAFWCRQKVNWAYESIQAALQTPEDNISELDGVMDNSLELLMPRNDHEELDVDQQQRTQEILIDLINKMHGRLERQQNQYQQMPPASRPKDHPAWVRSLAQVVHGASRHFHAATDDFAKHYRSLPPEKQPAALEQWWKTAEPILEAMLQAKHPSIAFDLIQGLEAVFEFDVPRTLHWLRLVTEANVATGLANESMAADHTIAMLQRILAEHRISLRDGTKIREDFLATLNAYIAVGWEQALRLAIQIESIFR